jgi:hypothetical protein
MTCSKCDTFDGGELNTFNTNRGIVGGVSILSRPFVYSAETTSRETDATWPGQTGTQRTLYCIEAVSAAVRNLEFKLTTNICEDWLS